MDLLAHGSVLYLGGFEALLEPLDVLLSLIKAPSTLIFYKRVKIKSGLL